MLSTLMQDIRDAVTGKPHDYTEGPIGKGILILAVPMILEMLMESIFIVVDIYFVGKLGSDAVAVVGLTEQILVLIYSVALGLSVVVAAMVARRVGEKRPEAAAQAAAQGMLLGVLVSLPIAAAGLLFPEALLRLMGASDAVAALGARNMMWMVGGNGVIVLLYLLNAAFRGAGDPAVAMRVLWVANGINILLDPCLIFGLGPFPALGVEGAAVATNIGRGVGIVMQLVILFRGGSLIRLSRRALVPDGALMLRMLRLAWWGIVQWTIGTASWIVLLRITALFGSAAIAGYAIAVRIMVFATLPAQGFAGAAATLVGQNLGAGKPERAARAAWLTAGYNMVFMAGVVTVFLLGNAALVSFFATDAAILAHGRLSLVTMSYGLVPYALGLVMSQAFNGAGDTTTPTVINFFAYWVFQIPLAYVLAVPCGWENKGVFVAIALAQALLAPLGVWRFRRGGWQHKVV